MYNKAWRLLSLNNYIKGFWEEERGGQEMTETIEKGMEWLESLSGNT